ncbi:hypothetical protein MCOR27_003388 [Pyricularia oryzae]|nr:hypothetical protein MCOR27_003388 [Pyricularia oryzae]
MASASPPSSRSEFQIAIVCALPLEADAVDLLFDGRFDDQRYGRARGDNNTYYAGRMAGHAVVLLQLPNMGPLSAASGSAGLRSSYPNVQLALLVGVCGGLPVINDQSVYLGDVVVSKRVVNYDFGRQYPDRFVPKDGVDDSLGRANKDIRGLLAWLQREHNLAILQKRAQEEYGSNKYSPLPDWDDRIFPSDYQHRHCSGECGTCDQGHFCQAAANSSCTEIGCDQGQQHSRAERRRERPSGLCPRVFIGSIASGNAVIKSGKHRDRIAEEHGVIAFEMEGAGAWDEIPCIVVKGICDYADSHKSKLWQNFAAATAASVAAAIIDRYEPSDMVATGISASGMSGPASRHADNSIYGGTNGIHPQNHGIAVNGSVSHGNVVSGTLVSGDYNAGTIVHGNYHGGSNGLCTLSGYPGVYQAQQQRLLNFSPGQAQSRYRSVHATFEASADVLEKSNDFEAQTALELLAALSVLHFRDVPLDVFQDAWRGGQVAKTIPSTDLALSKLTRWHVQRLPGFLQSDDAWNHDLVFSGAIARLRSLAFITTGTLRGVLTASMHPLVHEWLLLRQTEASRRGWRLAGACILMLSNFGTDWTWQPYRPLLMPHSTCLIQYEKWLSSMQNPSRQEVQLLELAARSLYKDKLLKEAVNIVDMIFRLLGGEAKALSADNFSLFRLMGTIQLELPRPNKAIRYFQYALQWSRKTLARDDKLRLGITRQAAAAFRQEGQQDEVLALLEEVLEVAKTELNNEGSLDIARLREVGSIYFEAGDTENAISIFERVVEYQAPRCSKFDADFLIDQTILGDAYYEDGQPDKAIEMFEEVSLIRKSTLPPSNPDRLNLEHNLALAYGGARKPKEAIRLLRHVVGVQATIYPKTHPAALLSRNMLNLALEMGKCFFMLFDALRAHGLTDSQKRINRDGYNGTANTLHLFE